MAACINDSRNQNATDPFPPYTHRYQINNSLWRLINILRPNPSNLVPWNSVDPQQDQKISNPLKHIPQDWDEDSVWLKICEEAKSDSEQEPILSKYYYSSILVHNSLESALATHLAAKLSSSNLTSDTLFEVFFSVLKEDCEIRSAIREDLKAAKERDPACFSYVHCFLHFKGFLACQAHRMAHKLWSQGRTISAFLIQNRVSEVFAVDIHPGAKIGSGILIDHGTGIVIGETAVIGNNVSILHNVTLGSKGKTKGDRHPKIGDGVLIGAGAQVLGNVKIGEGAKIGAGSVVLKEVPLKATVVGNPARLVGGNK
ncbi:Diamine acetyltransferase 1 [Sarracenia purpurea var. burkii]